MSYVNPINLCMCFMQWEDFGSFHIPLISPDDKSWNHLIMSKYVVIWYIFISYGSLFLKSWNFVPPDQVFRDAYHWK